LMIPKGSRATIIKAEQMRAARGLVDWSQRKLAEAAGLSVPTIKRAERDRGIAVSAEALAAIARALESAGVEFTNGGEPGVKLKKAKKR
jgi:transcriptional regulator with XRE-family HTH domain